MRFFSVKEYVWAMAAPWCVFGRDCRLKALKSWNLQPASPEIRGENQLDASREP